MNKQYLTKKLNKLIETEIKEFSLSEILDRYEDH